MGAMVYGTRTGTGKRTVLLIAHRDTVYAKGAMAKQPFRIDGDKAWGLGISDLKGGVALVLHTVQLLEQLGFRDCAQLGVLIHGDEEVGSPGSGALLTQLGSEYDAVFSFEAAGFQEDFVRLATSSIAVVELKITGKGSPAGASPERGRNALYELAHQILKTRNFGDSDKGLKINSQKIYADMGKKLDVQDRATGGGTDAAFAALRAKGGVLESLGLRGTGAHSSASGYILIESIAPRLYLSMQMVMDVGSGLLAW